MNKIYKVVWSKVKHCYVVTSELAKRQTKGCGAGSLRMATVSLGVAAALLYTGGALPLFSPSVAEAASYDAELKDDTTMRTFQATPKSFTIGESELPTGVTGISVYGNVALGMIPKIIASLPGDDGKTYGIRGIDWSQSTSLFSRASKSNPFGDTTAVTKRVNADRTQVITVSTTLGALMIEVGGANDVDGYTVTMESGQADEVVGGISYSGKVSNNTVNLNGGSVMSAYGGYTQGGAAETNHVVVDGGVAGFSSTGPVAGSYVYGGYSKNESGESKDVTGNTVTVKKGTVLASIFGGRTEASGSSGNSGDAIGNIVTVEDGTLAGDMYGGYSSSYWNTSGKVEGNKINITGGALDKVRNIQVNGIGLSETAGVRYIYGGYTDGDDASGIAKDNEVTISSGTFRSDVEVTGGYSNANNAEHNMVNIESTFTGMVGEVTGGEAGGNGTAKKNEVTISGGTVRDSNDSGVHVFGGKASTGSAIENKVTINKNATVNSHVDGGYTTAGTAENNEVTIDGGNVNGVVNGGSISYEGDTTPGAVTGNTVTIKNGSKVGFQNASGIYGGYVAGGRSYGDLANAGDVTGNKVFIMGGEVYDVYGGYTDSGDAKFNTVTISESGQVNNTVYGGYSNTGAVNNNTVSISGGLADFGVTGGYSNTGAVTNNKVTITSGTVIDGIRGGNTYDNNNSGDVKYNAVSISGDAKIRAEGIIGGLSWNSDAIGNTVTISGGSFEPLDPTDPVFNSIPITAGATNSSTAKEEDNVVNITGEVTGLDTASITGYSYGNSNHSGNELHIGGTKTYDSNGTATVNGSDAWQGKSSDGTVNNKVKSVALFESIVLHNVKWSTTLPVLEATKITNVGTLDITNMQFDQTPSNGESMALLKAGNDLGASGAGIGLAYKDGSTEKTATSAELATGVTFDSGALTDTAVNGVSVTGTQSKKVSLENSNYEIRYSFSSTISGITIATDTFTAGGTARAFGSGDNLTGATITNNLAFSPASKKNMASGTSMVILDATKAVAVSGATLPTFDATTYDVDFSDAIDSKVVTLNGKHTDTLAMNDTTARTQLIYTVGDKNVETATFNGAVDFSTGDAYYTADSQYKFSATNVDAKNLTFNETTEALTKDSSMTLLSATGLTAGTITQPDAPTVAINYGGDATNGITFNATATGSVAVEGSAVKFKVNTVEASKIDLSNWNGTPADVAIATSGWTLKAGETVETGELAKADLSGLKADETKTILTASDTVVFTNDAITGKMKWKEDGTSIAETTHESGVVISAGETTASGVKVNESNAHQLIYQQGKNNVTAITLGKVTFNTTKAAREFGNAYDLTAADIDATNFKIKDAEIAAMNAGEEMIVLDATKAIKGTGTATLKDFDTKSMTPIDFSDDISGTVLTFAGNHTDTLEQNAAKTQIVYKVGDKNVETVTLNGSVKWDDSKAYYTNDATKYKFATTNVDADKLTVTGTTTKLLKADGTSSMTLLSATGMTAGTITDQSDANKTASKVTVNYKDGQGIAFKAEAKGEVKAEAAAVKYNINEVKLTEVDLSAWTGSESSVPDTWTAEDKSVTVNHADAITVSPSSTQTILTAGSGMFKDVNVPLKAVAFDPVTQNGVTLEGTQTNSIKTTQTKVANDTITYEVGKKDVKTISIGSIKWKGATLNGSSEEYNYENAVYNTGGFAVSNLEDVEAAKTMTLLEANETLKEMAEETKTFAYPDSYEPAPGVIMKGEISGKLSKSGNNIVFTATENKATALTFGKVEWTGDTPLLDHKTTLKNVSFNGATVDTSNIDFYKEMYIEADQTTTLVSNFGEEAKITPESTKYMVGTAFEGESETKLEGGNLILRTKTSAGVSEQTHKAVMAVDANMALLATGNEYAGQVLTGLGDPANAGRDGVSTAAAIGGGWNRYDTGSHVNVNSWNAAVGIGAKRELKNGSLEYGLFGEYGKGNYKLHSEAGTGKGDAHYAGGGLLAKWTNKHDVYAEASFRLGRMSDSVNDLLRDGAGNAYGYDVHANYFGAHAGIGKIFRYKGGKSLDVYGKYFYTKRDGVEFDAKQHYNLDSVKSSVLRIGARYGTTDKKWNWYGGLAYEYEFDGDAKGTVNNTTAIRSASIKGSSVRGELGMRMNASEKSPWQVDISLYGYGGKHRGFGGNVNVAYTF